jgi:parallel beta-helix repeat protein
MDVGPDPGQVAALFEGFEPGGGERLGRYLAQARYKYDVAMREFLYRSYDSVFQFLNRRILIEGNTFESNWVHAQAGTAILFTVRNQDGAAPWSAVEDVVFRGNIVRESAAGMNVLGRDDARGGDSGRAERILVRDNLFVDNSVALHLEGSSRNAVIDNDFFRNGWAVRVLADAQGEIQRSSLDRHGMVEPLLDPQIHREIQFHRVARLPSPVQHHHRPPTGALCLAAGADLDWVTPAGPKSMPAADILEAINGQLG